ncbi:uncharacterized protein F4807DRAFT_97684 [Annulohypoxylon truncatum]|uniref:uncharacterized protein n=1 Tax=Annulohypoxylon truncatum TaxID=327061 RepID=UPI002007E86A|nr:uncharacterized protein F4807DRAFT_97684 [Annulohypoxylon truncatum]KAI1209586.1 hypothetical protein F4807DRAFT_97684 [Annulohypoxylon truncatum]
MSGRLLPDVFQQAVLNSRSYPRNIIYQTLDAYSKSATKAETRLGEREDDLFEDNELEWEVPIRDLDTECGKDVDKYNIHSHEKLLEWLGIKIQPSSQRFPIVTGGKKDPKCRFINIYGLHSRSKLRLTRAMFTDILTFHQVMPAFLEFIHVFGQQGEFTDLHFTGFREQVILTNPPKELIIPELGRSGKHYQICFNLKGVSLKSECKEDFMLNEWSIRPAVFHHQFDVSNGNTLWIVIKGNQEIQDRFKALTGKDARAQDKSFGSVEESFHSSLSAHLLYCHWAMEDWRWYIVWLEKAVDKKHLMAVLGPSGVGHAHKIYTPPDIQDLQIWEERTRQVIMALESNADIMFSLVMFYRRLTEDKNFPLEKSCYSDICYFGNQVENIISDFRMQIKRAELLIRTISDRRQLVIQHLQSQSAYRAESLGRSMEQEQIFMLVITIVTLIFLPATFVSTFFSTDIIKYQDPDSPEGSFSAIAMSRWLEVTIPLTVVTCGVAWWARRWKLMKRRAHEVGLEQPITSSKLKGPLGSSATLLPLHNKSTLGTRGSFLERVMKGKTF